MSRRCGAYLVVLAVVSALALCGPLLYWRFKISCPPCLCHCPPPLTLFSSKGLANLSVSDCGSNDPDVKKEMEKRVVDLLAEELKLQESVAKDQDRRMSRSLADARRLASKYQREADKCVAATKTCEQARERAEALLIIEKNMTLLWEQRAHLVGWQGE